MINFELFLIGLEKLYYYFVTEINELLTSCWIKQDFVIGYSVRSLAFH